MPTRTIAGGLPAPMLAKLEPEIPREDGWTYEPKWDGFRAIARVTADGVADLVSRDGRPLGRYFPELLELLERTSAGEAFVADGEIVRIAAGRMDFDELQLRLHPASSRVRMLAAEIPATLILFDLLEEAGEDLRERPLQERRARLATLAGRIGAERTPEQLDELPPGPDLRLTPWTEAIEDAERWYADEAGLGQDGIVAKRIDQPYQPGVRGWVKVKHRSTADCVVGGYRLAKDGDGVGSLLLGLFDPEGRLHYVGHTSSFRAAERRAIREALTPLQGGAGFGEDARSPGGQSRWTAGREAEWVPLDPVVVCEVSFDRMQHGRFRHAATFVRWREDRTPASCTFDQVDGSPPSWG
jgi:ATP-dependent DNA ligase